jgi:hypothetical protein
MAFGTRASLELGYFSELQVVSALGKKSSVFDSFAELVSIQ